MSYTFGRYAGIWQIEGTASPCQRIGLGLAYADKNDPSLLSQMSSANVGARLLRRTTKGLSGLQRVG